ncbi:hypothetical protein BJI67_05030 [Acidihalobacter aeolianus]|uniref:Nucleoprotein/polynucleotide-associated enzyme n=1 Tax=Acidihalobacter aeolianus TaxID=2792603 RepID=A0A1D8K6E0_9GAMM|nr:DUF2058 family protein [Acidihalobacter aeolianus]AOV16519.1 hypothetical protein BJI67_05030 [Acidihalobacter aeolianus]
MNNALRDQLLKAGLVTEDQVKAADDGGRKAPAARGNDAQPRGRQQGKRGAQAGQRRQPAQSRDVEKPAVKPAPARRKPAKSGKAAKANPAQTPSPYAHLDKATREAVRRFLRENRVNGGEGETPYHFQEGAAVRKIWITSEQRQALTEGTLVIVPRNERYYVIDAALTEGLLGLDPKAEVIRADAQTGGDEEEDPAYKDHPIPDDLVW